MTYTHDRPTKTYTDIITRQRREKTDTNSTQSSKMYTGRGLGLSAVCVAWNRCIGLCCVGKLHWLDWVCLGSDLLKVLNWILTLDHCESEFKVFKQ